jgi:hypothetical protein
MRRPGRPEDAAARGLSGRTRESVGRYAAATSEPVPDPVLTGVVAQILPGEAGIPRWRRPSLKEARYQSDRVTASVTRKLTFAAPAAPGVERSIVRYDLVPLLDHPDEVTGLPIAELRAGDEIDVISRRAVWVEVRTPTGRAGWLHRTTLEAAAEAPREARALDAAEAAGAGDAPAAGDPDPRALDQILAAIVAERLAAAAATAAPATAAVAAEPAVDETGSKPVRKRGAKAAPRGATARAATDRAATDRAATPRAAQRPAAG